MGFMSSAVNVVQSCGCGGHGIQQGKAIAIVWLNACDAPVGLPSSHAYPIACATDCFGQRSVLHSEYLRKLRWSKCWEYVTVRHGTL